MKRVGVLFVLVSILILSCNSFVDKPDNLVSKDDMEQMLYDLAVLEALKAQNPTQAYPSPSQYIQQKYQVDSITFANSSKYYAADIKTYRKMYDHVKERLAQDRDASLK
jgi:hypothetical protein